MNICITGFGWSGSGALFDMLREYDDVQIIDCNGCDFEFYLLSDPDGIRTLDYHLNYVHNRINSYRAINRFFKLTEAFSKAKFLHYDVVFKGQFMDLTNKYVDSLIDFSLKSSTYYEVLFPSFKLRLIRPIHTFFFRVFRKLSNITGLHNNPFPFQIGLKEMLCSYNPECFMQKTHQYLNSLLTLVDDKSGNPMIFDQIFPPDSPQDYMKYLPQSKCIVVRRDPRDTYLLAKCTYNSLIPLPTDTVEDFVTFYKKVIVDSIIPDSNEILSIWFEDLIFKYEETRIKVETFLGISLHTRSLSLFDPSVSINNTNLIERYPHYKSDIEYIEKTLPEALYPFEKYPHIRTSDKVF